MLLKKKATTLCETRHGDTQVNGNPTQVIPEF